MDGTCRPPMTDTRCLGFRVNGAPDTDCEVVLRSETRRKGLALCLLA